MSDKLLDDVVETFEDTGIAIIETIFPKSEKVIDDVKKIEKDIQEKKEQRQEQDVEQMVQNVNETKAE